MQNIICWLLPNQIIMYFYVCFLSIVVICIDNCKWLCKELSCADNSMAGSPWFGSVCRFHKAFRKLLHFLICIRNFCDLLYSCTNGAFKFFFQILTDNKYNFIEASLQCVSDGIIHNDLTIWSNWCKLLDSISKSASNSGCHNYKSCFFHR